MASVLLIFLIMFTQHVLFCRFMLLLMPFITLCCQRPAATPGNETGTAVIDNTVASILPDTLFSGIRDTVILLKNDEAYIRGYMSGNRHKLNYQLPAWKGQLVTAHLQPLSKGQVCFIQVKEPGQDPIGPLGDSVQLKLGNSGNIYYTVGDTRGKGKGYSGDFVMHIAVRQAP